MIVSFIYVYLYPVDGLVDWLLCVCVSRVSSAGRSRATPTG